ncbi:MAG: DUF4097 family beta strand repeat-containing protein [Janthinobacterium lividum]
MQRLLFLSLLLSSLLPAVAQRLVSQPVPLAAGQGIFLNVRFARTIRVRPGAQALVQARVSLNANQNNDLFSLTTETSGGEVRVLEKLDEEKLRQSHFDGDCDGGNFTNRSDGVNVSHTRAPKPGRRTNGSYNYCAQIDYEVTLPPGTPLHVTTISGNLDVSSLTGPVAVETISGNLTLDHLTGPVTASSISGNVKLTQPGNAPLKATSVSGNVEASWPAQQSASLLLKSVSGEVYAAPAVTFSNLKPHSNVGYELQGTLGTGSGPLVKLESVSGDVFFRTAD